MGTFGAHCNICNERGHWSDMDCGDKEPHAPHVWNSEYTVYGPYKCFAGQQRIPMEVKK